MLKRQPDITVTQSVQDEFLLPGTWIHIALFIFVYKAFVNYMFKMNMKTFFFYSHNGLQCVVMNSMMDQYWFG